MELIDTTLPPEEPARLWRGKDVLVMSLFAVGAILVGAGGIMLLTERGMTQNTMAISLAMAGLETVVLVAAVYFFGLRRRNLTWADIGVRLPSLNWGLASLAIGLSVIPLAGLIALGIQLALGQPLENPQLEFLAPQGINLAGMLGMLVLGGVAVPFAEELFFRGVLYRWMRERWNLPLGMVLSSLIFGAVHGEVSVAAAAAVLGLILAWVYERSKSLWPAVVIHAVNNSLKIALLYTLMAFGIPLE